MNKITILIVEDEGIVAQDLKNILTDMGYRVPAIASSGEMAIRQAAEEQPDLILMDIVLQGAMDGIEAAAKIQAERDVPILFLTAYADRATIERAKRVGPYSYVIKPFDELRLATTIEMALHRHRLEQRVREDETRLRTIFESATDGIFLIDMQGRYHDVNPAGCRMFGYTRDEIIGQDIRLLLYPEDIEAAYAGGQRAWREGAVIRETRMRKKDGSPCWVEMIITPLTISGQQFALGIKRDISERRRLLQEMEEQERFLTALNDIARAALQAPDLDTALKTLANRLVELFQADHCYITRWDESTQCPIPTAASGALHEAYSRHGIPKERRTMTGSVLQAGRPLIAEDVFDTPYLDPRIAARFPSRSLLGLPLIVGERKLGAILIGFAEPHTFTPQELARSEQVVQHIALAVAKMQAIGDEHTQRLQAETLAEVTLALTAKTHLGAVLEEILVQARRIVPYVTANIALLEDDVLHTVHWKGYDLRSELWEQIIPGLEQPLADWPLDAQVVRTREPLVIPDTAQEPRWVITEPTAWIRAYLSAPICARDRVLGLLRLDSDTPGAFTGQDAARLMPLTNAAAIALENVRLLTELRQRVDEMDTLYRISLQINARLDLPTVLDTIADSALSLVGGTDCHIYLYDPDSDTFTFGTALWSDGRREPAVAAPRKEGLTATVAREGRPLVINDAQHHPLYTTPEAKAWNVQAVAGFPLKRADRVVGVFTIAFLEPHTFDQDELRVLELLAEQAVIAIENARLVGGLEAEVAARVAEVVAEQQKTDTLLRAVGDAILFFDLDLKAQYVNPAFERLTGYSADHILGQELSKIDERFLVSADLAAIRKVIQRGETWQGEMTVRRRDGRTYDAAVTIAPVHDAKGALSGFVASHRDISRQKELARARTRFLSNLSHELRTPVTNLKIHTHLLRQSPTPEKARRYVQALTEQTERLHHLVQDILTMSALDSGQAVTQWEPLSPADIVADTLDRFKEAAERASVTLHAAPVPPLPPVSGDADLVAQALGELVENGVVFTPAGGQVTIEVASRSEAGQTWVTLTVRDTGPGISPEEQARIFERFFRGSLAEHGHVPGTGLGLSIVHAIMEAHGGRVTVESKPGAGSAFTLWLRVASTE